MNTHPLLQAVADLRHARYVAVGDQTDYINAVADLAEECAWHMHTLGINWHHLADNATNIAGTSIENALTGAVYDYRNNHTD